MFIVGNITDSTIANNVMAQMATGSKKVYGVQFASDGTAVRTYDAKGLIFEPSSTTVSGQDDFINADNGKSPFHIRECLSQYNSSTGKQEIIAYEGDTGYATKRANSAYNVMIEFPKFYYSRPAQYEWIVSSYPHEGFLPSPMHYRNGVMHDYVYVAKYMSNSSYMSRPGQTIVTNPTWNNNDGTGYTIANFRTNFRSKGMYNIDYAVVCSINILMLVKYASLNIQNVIGYGWTGTNQKASTGGADGVKGKDGYTASDKMSTGQIVAMGIEDYWGNIWKFVDGVFQNGGAVYINTDIENITTNPSSSNHPGYLAVPSGTVNSDNGYYWITEFNYDSQFPWSFLPASANFVSASPTWPVGDPGLKISDGYWVNPASNDYTMLVGGNYNYGFACGPFFVCLDDRFSCARPHFSGLSFFLS